MRVVDEYDVGEGGWRSSGSATSTQSVDEMDEKMEVTL